MTLATPTYSPVGVMKGLMLSEVHMLIRFDSTLVIKRYLNRDSIVKFLKR